MKRIIAILVLALSVLGLRAQVQPDFSVLEKSAHPRLIMNDKDFKAYTKILNKGTNKPLVTMHTAIMEEADRIVEKPKNFVYKKAASGRLSGNTGAVAVRQLWALSYAYRYTKDPRYVEVAEQSIRELCAYPDWAPERFLNTGHFAFSLAIAYDWMYKALDRKLKAEMVKTVQEFCFVPSRDPKIAVWKKMTNNHNEVDNANLVCSAIAFYEHNPEESQRLIKDALETNPACLREMYSPEGAYPEGPGYWRYGSQHEILLLTALQKTFGTTFNLDDPSASGWNNTGTYALYIEGNTGKWFNFYDCASKASRYPELWYFAWKTGDYSIVFREIDYLRKSKKGYVNNTLAVLYNMFAANYDGREVTPPSGRVYHAYGNVPLCLARTGWEKDDLFLGIKGGRANFTHGQMDAATFVFDAYGVRWAADIDHKPYGKDEVGLKKLGASLWNRRQGQVRWKIMSNDNHFHNTLTVNDKEQVFDGFCTLEEVFEDPSAMGARIDASAAYFDLDKALRTALIKDDSYLEITEELRAGAEADASVRWTLMTEATPEVKEGGILLKKGGKKMMLVAEGCEVNYTTWSTDPKDYPDNPCASFDEQPKGIACCGFTFTAPAGKDMTLVVTLKPIE